MVDIHREVQQIQIPQLDSDEACTGSGDLQFLDPVLPVSFFWKEHPESRFLHLVVQVTRKSQILGVEGNEPCMSSLLWPSLPRCTNRLQFLQD